MPEDFGLTKNLENAGILDVFQVFQTALLGRKIGHPGEKEFLEVPFSLSFSLAPQAALALPLGELAKIGSSEPILVTDEGLPCTNFTDLLL